MKKSVLLFCLLMLCSILNTHAQNGIIGRFEANQLNEGIRISFTVNSGNQCFDVEVQRSADALNFYSLYSFPGVCGNASFATDYFYTDYSPLANTVNYYRLKIGILGYSPVASLHFYAPGEGGYLLLPSEDGNSFTLLFNDLNGETATLQLFDISGRLLQSQSGITGRSAEFLNPNGSRAVYIFRLLKENGKAIIGKIFL